MLVAQREYQFAEVERQHKQSTTPAIQPKKKPTFKAGEKAKIIFTILLLCTFCIGVLLGYAYLAEMKYKIHLTQKEIKELESNIQILRVEVESVQRLDLIEEKAEMELGMVYPIKDQMVYLDLENINLNRDPKIDTEQEMNPNHNVIAGVKLNLQKLIR